MARFISAQIEVSFKVAPLLTKRTGPPDAFDWDGQHFPIVAVLAEWHEYDKRRERDTTRRSQARLTRAHGSWGLGRDFYRVRTGGGRVFDLYYDRSPKGADDIGRWVLYTELEEGDALEP
jgi:hypothetical protein